MEKTIERKAKRLHGEELEKFINGLEEGKYLAKRSVLIGRREVRGKKVDVKTEKGQIIVLSDEDAVRMWGALEISEKQKKRLLSIAKQEGYKRVI